MNGTGRDTAGSEVTRQKKTEIDARAASHSHNPGPEPAEPAAAAAAPPAPAGTAIGAVAGTAALTAGGWPLT